MNNEIQQQYKKEDDEISLKELILKIKEWWGYLWSKKWIIIAAGIVGGLLGLGYAYTKHPTYIATTTFVLEANDGASGGLGQYSGLASMVGIDLGGSGGGIFQGDNILELYKSRSMLGRTLLTTVQIDGKKQTLMERYISMNNMRAGWAGRPELLKLRFDSASTVTSTLRLRDSVLNKVIENIATSNLLASRPEKKLSIIKVKVTSPDEVFSKLFNDQLVKNVNSFYVQTKTKKASDNVAILQQKTDSVRAVMNGAIYSSVAIVDATPNLNPTRQVQRVVPVQRAQLSAETNKAILSSLVQNLELSKLSLMKETPLIQIVDTPVYPLLKEKFGKLKGIIFGGLLLGFLITFYLVISKALRDILS